MLGVVEVYVDQTEREARISQAFGLMTVVIFALLILVGGGAAVVLGRRMRLERLAEDRIRFLAQHDVLSGLLNRSSFNDALHEAAWRHSGGGPAFSVLQWVRPSLVWTRTTRRT
jgi:hypothetical protein